MELDEWAKIRPEAVPVALADVPMLIRCRNPEIIRRLQAYRTVLPPVFVLEPTVQDLLLIQAQYHRVDRFPVTYTPFFLEFTAIHRLVVERLLQEQVLMLHGSALRMDGEGYVFSARSGTGKSTHASLWRDAFGSRVQMINDDKPLLRIREDAVTVHGSPWNGKHHLGDSISAPLRMIYFLSRSQTNHAESLTAAEAFPLLAGFVYHPEDPLCAAQALALENHLLQLVRCCRLRCNMLPEAAQVAKQAAGMPPV